MNKDKYIEIFKATVRGLYPGLTTAEWEYILSNCQFREVKTKTNIIESGKFQKDIHFIANGLVRGFYINDKGEDISVRFINNQGWVIHYSALLTKTASRYTYQALEPCCIISFPFKSLTDGYQKFHGYERFGRLLAENIMVSLQRRIENFQFLNAEARYKKFMSEEFELYNRISTSHLSTYLGIKRQSLTRIRKKIATQ